MCVERESERRKVREIQRERKRGVTGDGEEVEMKGLGLQTYTPLIKMGK